MQRKCIKSCFWESSLYKVGGISADVQQIWPLLSLSVSPKSHAYGPCSIAPKRSSQPDFALSPLPYWQN